MALGALLVNAFVCALCAACVVTLRRGAAMCFMSSAGTGFALVEGVDPLLKAAWRLWATRYDAM